MIDKAAQADTGRYLTFREVERHRGMQVVDLRRPNAGDGLALIQAFAPDLIVSIRYGAIFKAPVIAVPPLGILNLHAGILPAYRGVIATFRALMAGEKEIGCTLHYMTDGTIDTGAIVSQVRIPVDSRSSLFKHVLSLYPVGRFRSSRMRSHVSIVAKRSTSTRSQAGHTTPTRAPMSGTSSFVAAGGLPILRTCESCSQGSWRDSEQAYR